jgi:methyl-accepting chemotaxis protein
MTRIATEITSGDSPRSALALASRLRARLGREEPALLLAFASGKQPLNQIVGPLAEGFAGAAVLGVSTTGGFVEDRRAKGAAAVFALAGDYRVHAGIGARLREDPARAVAEAAQRLPRAIEGYPHKTALMLLDPLSDRSEEATRIAAATLGPDVRVVGGAAGEDKGMQPSQVACGADVRGDAVVISLIFSKTPLGIGVSSGHTPITRPLRVTRAEGNVVMEIEGQPAWKVWRDQTRIAALDHDIDVDSMSPECELAFLLRFAATVTSGAGGGAGGADAFGGALRAPLARGRDGSIAFACGVECGALLRIAESSAAAQARVAREAARRAGEELGGKRAAGAVVFDCVCRDMLLRGAFMSAVRGVSEELGDAPLAGCETFGEIARREGEASGFHNTTSVVLAFPAA